MGMKSLADHEGTLPHRSSYATVLTAQATGCTPMQHALTQIPYALIAAAISLLGYLLIAFW